MQLLLPPYQDSPSSEGTGGLPLGAIGLCHVTGAACVARLTEIVRYREPWLPIVVAAPSTLRRAVGSILENPTLGSPGQFVPLTHDGTRPPAAGYVLRTVNQGPPPSAEILARWLGLRLTRPAVTTLIRAMLDLEYRARHDGHIRTLRRQVHAALGCRPSDLARLAGLAALPRLAPTVLELAAEAGTTAFRLRRRVVLGLGVSLADFNRMPGWGWVLEAAVRRGLGAGGWGLAEGNALSQGSERD